MNRFGIYNTFFFLLMLVVFCGIGKLLSPFAGALLAALMCSVTFYPLYQRLQRWFPHFSSTLCAALADVLVLVFIVTPIITLSWAVMQESNTVVDLFQKGNSAVTQWRQGDTADVFSYMNPVRRFLSESFGVRQAQFQEQAAGIINALLEQISVAGTFIAKNIFSFILNAFVMLFALFFMFRDGEHFLAYIESTAPMRQENKDRIAAKVRDTVVGLVRGLLMTAVIQGATATIGYWIVGVKAAILLGALTSFMGLVPVVGTFGVWVPIGVTFLLKGAYFKGFFILLWGGILVVGVMDTFVRPYLVGKKADLPMFALFLGLLGGVEVWGAKGVLLGPVLLALAPVLLQIYQEQYARQKALGESSGLPPVTRAVASHLNK